MEPSLIKCTKCQALLWPNSFNTGELIPCDSCGSLLEVDVFPAILQAPVAAMAEALLVEGESSCFYHPTKKAAIVCQGCGRFLCALCDLELNGRHVCPVCLESGQKKGKYKDLENSRIVWDRIALAVSIVPVVGGPAALYMVLRYRKAPCSLTGKSNLSFIVAALIALSNMAISALLLRALWRQ